MGSEHAFQQGGAATQHAHDEQRPRPLGSGLAQWRDIGRLEFFDLAGHVEPFDRGELLRLMPERIALGEITEGGVAGVQVIVDLAQGEVEADLGGTAQPGVLRRCREAAQQGLVCFILAEAAGVRQQQIGSTQVRVAIYRRGEFPRRIVVAAQLLVVLAQAQVVTRLGFADQDALVEGGCILI